MLLHPAKQTRGGDPASKGGVLRELDWHEGARWFWDTLVDANLASDTLGWQWTIRPPGSARSKPSAPWGRPGERAYMRRLWRDLMKKKG